jgi:nucleoside-diphosphate-sugar epimerase
LRPGRPYSENLCPGGAGGQAGSVLPTQAEDPSFRRPTVVFGPGDILVNDIAWMLRRFLVVAMPGDGTYRLRPVHVHDVARPCVQHASRDATEIVDAVGPDTFTLEDFVP